MLIIFKLVIDPDLCKSCGYCIAFCKKDVLTVGDETNRLGYRFVRVANQQNCVGCKMCATMCGEGAISIFKED